MTARKELWQNTIQQLDLAGVADEFIVDETARVHLVFDTLEDERVLTDLAKLHQLVAQPLDPALLATPETTCQLTVQDGGNEKK
jgi:esterase/lipase superfamily enzyme